MKRFFVLVLLLVGAQELVFGQQKGDFYLYWGWNRGYFADSDIRFLGNDYNFKLNSVKAHDRQTAFGKTYFNLGDITIPQYNFRVGYYFHDKWNVSFGIDHMKYVMDQDQIVKMDGFINRGSDFDGVFSKDDRVLDVDFLSFEHTDGLNYANLELRRLENLWNIPVKKNRKAIAINLIGGAGGGLLYPRTNTRLLGQDRYDQFHLSGYGVSAVTGINVTFWKWFFLQTELKGGYIRMGDIRTTQFKEDRATQSIWFLQDNVVLGANIPVFRKKSKA